MEVHRRIVSPYSSLYLVNKMALQIVFTIGRVDIYIVKQFATTARQICWQKFREGRMSLVLYNMKY